MLRPILAAAALLVLAGCSEAVVCPGPADAGAATVCVRECGDRTCGDDGCGGSCGGCAFPETCDHGGCRLSSRLSCRGVLLCRRACAGEPVCLDRCAGHGDDDALVRFGHLERCSLDHCTDPAGRTDCEREHCAADLEACAPPADGACGPHSDCVLACPPGDASCEQGCAGLRTAQCSSCQAEVARACSEGPCAGEPSPSCPLYRCYDALVAPCDRRSPATGSITGTFTAPVVDPADLGAAALGTVAAELILGEERTPFDQVAFAYVERGAAWGDRMVLVLLQQTSQTESLVFELAVRSDAWGEEVLLGADDGRTGYGLLYRLPQADWDPLLGAVEHLAEAVSVSVTLDEAATEPGQAVSGRLDVRLEEAR